MFNLNLYLKRVTETFAELQTPGDHYARVSSIFNIEEVLHKMRTLQGIIIMPVDAHDGVLGDNGHDQFRDQPQQRFYILQKVKIGDIDERATALDQCKALAKRIIFKMQTDKMEGRNGLQFVSLARITYISVGPIADNYHGIEIFIDLVQKMWETPPTLTTTENFDL